MSIEIKQLLDNLTDHCLEESGIFYEYNDKDLFNATHIFNHIFTAKMYEYHKDKLTKKQMEQIAEEAGKSIRQTIQLFTGKDTWKTARELTK